ncbi:ABC-type Fe3+-hydroxamate transport system substrate-binding protein [Nocardioides luteus]|uniref:ABC transporter substrate-binding protein n=1 Tax=Nocardioides luteus TaxID=1844 RepID=A0ABQ5SY73_9ACTN|nr:helical backbone metal receptor [Nocardioides luteus]MDR7312267.1 ABC-type Fe3+-hydroxamate transport system substrate-binding protein [Nocardioides luteus]GGR57117.1 ABC transporter substrate-binding protein [Nocardioides luteus]GLJ68513.1 ABC transporter substrate-binding protein [Nocardioides luteus]
MDDLGTPYDGPRPAARVVSLVPSLTEALVSVAADRVVGATEWCTHPADLDVPRVRGTKNPDLAAISSLSPDVVVANKEENRELDVRRLRERGIRVWVTDIETVPQAVGSMGRLLDGLGWDRPDWLAESRRLWCGPLPQATRRVVVPIWRDPWMVVGSRTFTGDLLRRLGWENLYGTDALNPAGDRYPHADLADIDAAGADVVLLPDEPYVFTADDGPEAFTRTPTELVSGRLITWYGPSLVEAASLASG